MNPRIAIPFALLLVLAACTPTPGTGPAGAPATPTDASELQVLERTAWEAWHLMELGRLRTGAYTTNVLVDLPIPQGVRWTVLAFDEDGYVLSVTGEEDAAGYVVEPAGVRTAR